MLTMSTTVENPIPEVDLNVDSMQGLVQSGDGEFRTGAMSSCSRTIADRSPEVDSVDVSADLLGMFIPTRSKSCNALHAAACEAMEFEFQKSGYPLQKVRCHLNDRALELTGTVGSYYHLQVTIEIARRFANGRRIRHAINVATPS